MTSFRQTIYHLHKHHDVGDLIVRCKSDPLSGIVLVFLGGTRYFPLQITTGRMSASSFSNDFVSKTVCKSYMSGKKWMFGFRKTNLFWGTRSQTKRCLNVVCRWNQRPKSNLVCWHDLAFYFSQFFDSNFGCSCQKTKLRIVITSKSAYDLYESKQNLLLVILQKCLFWSRQKYFKAGKTINAKCL